MEEDVHKFRETFGFTINIRLGVSEEDECIIDGAAMRVVLL